MTPSENHIEAERRHRRGLVAAFSAFSGTGPEPELDAGQIERIRARITKLNEQWQATGPGEMLRLNWPSDTTPA